MRASGSLMEVRGVFSRRARSNGSMEVALLWAMR